MTLQIREFFSELSSFGDLELQSFFRQSHIFLCSLLEGFGCFDFAFKGLAQDVHFCGRRRISSLGLVVSCILLLLLLVVFFHFGNLLFTQFQLHFGIFQILFQLLIMPLLIRLSLLTPCLFFLHARRSRLGGLQGFFQLSLKALFGLFQLMKTRHFFPKSLVVFILCVSNSRTRLLFIFFGILGAFQGSFQGVF